jgi:hypothetical protein
MKLEHTGPASTPIWKTQGGLTAFYFKSNSDVNTDGSGRSYHPDDIAGNKGLAQNIFCNGVKMKTSQDIKVCAGPNSVCQPCLDRFRSIDRNIVISRFTDYFVPVAIATEGKKACVVPQGQENAGFFVSTTKYSMKNPNNACDPKQFLDSMVFPSIAVPDSLITRGVKMGDFVVVRNLANGRQSFGVVGDSSGGRIGESSIAMNRSLLCRAGHAGCESPPMPTTLKQSYALVVEKVDYLIFAGTASTWPNSVDEINSQAEAIFNNWGGPTRLAACAAAYGH